MEYKPIDYEISIGKHKEQAVIWLRFSYDRAKIEAVQSIGAKWSQSSSCWYLKDTVSNRNICGLYLVANAKLSETNMRALRRMQETLELKGYSPSTIRTYSSEFVQLLQILKEVDVSTLTSERLRSYLLYCFRELRLSENSVHSRLNAIKFYFEQVLHREKFFADIPRPKRPAKLPKVLNEDEVKRIFEAVKNPKHNLMLELCYGMGLRVSEIVKIRLCHIDSGRMQVLIEGSKGKKDRYVHLPHSTLVPLRTYCEKYLPKDYLFEGEAGGQYSIRSVQMVFKTAISKAGINKSIGVHGLRHSYATHLHEYGTDCTDPVIVGSQ